MKIIFNGTESLYLVKFPKQVKWTKIFYIISLRVFVKLSQLFVYEYHYIGDLVKRNIEKFGLNKKMTPYQSPVWYPDKIKKIEHNGFNVLYYFPNDRCNRFVLWLYGYDIFSEIKKQFPQINFIEVDGHQDMYKVYPIIDLLIRPNRHDGLSRMIRECELNEIPYIWTQENPILRDFIEKIKYYYDKKISNIQVRPDAKV